jgi:hypothetical protein
VRYCSSGRLADHRLGCRVRLLSWAEPPWYEEILMYAYITAKTISSRASVWVEGGEKAVDEALRVATLV